MQHAGDSGSLLLSTAPMFPDLHRWQLMCWARQLTLHITKNFVASLSNISLHQAELEHVSSLT